MSIALVAQGTKRSQQIVLIKPLWWLKAVLYRFWWHIRAYSTILGILILVLLSLVVLSLQRLIETRKPLAESRKAIEEIW